MSTHKYNIGDDVVAVIRGKITAVTEYASGYYSYRVTGTEPAGDRYNKFIDEQFIEAATQQPANDLPAFVTRAA